MKDDKGGRKGVGSNDSRLNCCAVALQQFRDEAVRGEREARAKVAVAHGSNRSQGAYMENIKNVGEMVTAKLKIVRVILDKDGVSYTLSTQEDNCLMNSVTVKEADIAVITDALNAHDV